MRHPLRRKDAPPQSARDTARDPLASGIGFLLLEMSHIRAFARLPRLQGDPFDRLLVAQALSEDMRLVTRDRRLAAYGSPVISW